MRNTFQGQIDCMFQSWTLGIGDPTAIGWVTTIAFIVAGTFCLGAAPLRRGPRYRQFWFWFGLALFLFFLGANKQLDLQSGMIELGRCVAESNNWYENRRDVQFALVAGIAIVLVFLSARMLVKSILSGASNLLAVIGFIAIMVFFLVRAAAFSHVDIALSADIFGVAVIDILELVGAGMIFVNACIMLAVTESR